ncbi:HMG1/2-like protein [Bactrocera tryoni]|uniref:HMG1/2-like protein n=1 Tax=Bactrocera tryoni TaxID=59916 RepID=UPI001A96720F|nr:HMG1/2-like protein [Bactrocera tryoni]
MNFSKISSKVSNFLYTYFSVIPKVSIKKTAMTGNKSDEANSHAADSSDKPKSKATNPFFIFLHEFRQNLMKRGAYKHMTAKEIACAAGERWRQMSSDEKLNYVVWARKNQQQLDPRLRVSPGKTGQREVHSNRSESKTVRRRGSRQKKVTMQKRRPSYIK